MIEAMTSGITMSSKAVAEKLEFWYFRCTSDVLS